MSFAPSPNFKSDAVPIDYCQSIFRLRKDSIGSDTTTYAETSATEWSCPCNSGNALP